MKVRHVYIPLFISLLLSLTFINLGSAQIKPSIRVEPTYYTGRPGDTFDLKLYVYDTNIDEGTEVYAWQVMLYWSGSILSTTAPDVTFGTFMNTTRIGPWGLLTQDAPAGQKIVNVTDGSRFASPGSWGGLVLIQDGINSEWNTLVSQTGNMLTMQDNLANTYTVAAGGGAYPHPQLSQSAVPVGSRITVGETTQGAPPGVSGSGWLATVTFTVLAEGTTTLWIDHSTFGAFTYIINTLGETLGDDPSGGGDPGNYQSELFKEDGYFILPLPEDINADGSVDIFDLASVAVWWGETVPPAPPEVDMDGNDYIDITDLSLVSVTFGTYANV